MPSGHSARAVRGFDVEPVVVVTSNTWSVHAMTIEDAISFEDELARAIEEAQRMRAEAT